MSNLGQYKVGDKLFEYHEKLAALRLATAASLPVEYTFHNDVWETFDLTTLPKLDLKAMYLARALQLRSKYEYLVLHYSGGSDSHNILRTFLDNGIHLDEVVVKWSPVPKDRNWYDATKLAGHAKDSLAEWDLALKPSLDWLRVNHPKIKVTLVDFTENLGSTKTDVDFTLNRISSIALSRGAFGSYVNRVSQDTEAKMAEASGRKTTAHIFGIEKPLLSVAGKSLYFYFTDVGAETAVLERDDLREAVELFYWTKDLPHLAYAQAYAAGAYLRDNPKAQSVLFPTTSQDVNSVGKSVNAQSLLYKKVLYPHTWDPRKFQAPKPNVLRSDWWWWLHESPELATMQASFNTAMTELTKDIRKELLIVTPKVSLLKPLATRPFFLMHL